MANARKARKLVIFGTDGLRQSIIRGTPTIYTLPDDHRPARDLNEARQQYNMWWARYVLPHLKEAVKPYRIIRDMKYLRKNMLYWGVIAQK